MVPSPSVAVHSTIASLTANSISLILRADILLIVWPGERLHGPESLIVLRVPTTLCVETLLHLEQRLVVHVPCLHTTATQQT